MRTVPTVILSGVLALASACASNRPAGPQPNYYITPSEMLEVYGVYHLSNGETLRVTRAQGRYWADMSRSGKVEMLPVASIAFAARGGADRFEFTPLAFATDVRITRAGPGLAVTALSGRSAH